MKLQPSYSPEVRERAVRLVLTTEHDHTSRWAATQSVAAKIGCTAETLRKWINRTEVDSGVQSGVTSDQSKRFKEMERENRELKRANEILRKAAAFFAQLSTMNKQNSNWTLPRLLMPASCTFPPVP